MITGFDKDEKAWIEVKGEGGPACTPSRVLSHNYNGVILGGGTRCYHLRKGRDGTGLAENIGASRRMYRKGEIRRRRPCRNRTTKVPFGICRM